jgi:hypothetical protein
VLTLFAVGRVFEIDRVTPSPSPDVRLVALIEVASWMPSADTDEAVLFPITMVSDSADEVVKPFSTVCVEVETLVEVVVYAAVVTDVSVNVVGGRDRGTRIRVADTRTPATNIAAATYARLLFPLRCNANSTVTERRFSKYLCPNAVYLVHCASAGAFHSHVEL